MADLAEDSGSLGAQLRSAGLLEYQLNGLCPTWEWSRHGTLGGIERWKRAQFTPDMDHCQPSELTH